MTRFLCTEKADKKFCKTRGEEQFKETDSRQQHASSLKAQAQGRKDTPGRSKVFLMNQQQLPKITVYKIDNHRTS